MITFQTPEILILIIIVLVILPKLHSFAGLKKWVGALNIIVVTLLIVSAAGPQLTLEHETEPMPQLNVIEDSSESSNLIQDTAIESSEVNIRRSSVNSDRSNFPAQVKNSVSSNETVLFISDFQTELEDLPEYFEQQNISSNVLRTDMEEEHAVRLEGPTTTVIGAQNSFTAEVSSTPHEQPEVTVGIGNQTIYTGEPPHEFDHSFDKEGYYRLWAEIETQDEFSENNRYYKTVRVSEKPEIASIGPGGGLEQQLGEFYEINNYDHMPSSLENYQNVILKQEESSQQLEDYIIEGGGLVYTGNNYNPRFLPVEKTEEEASTDAPLVVLLMDISQNMGCPSEDICAEDEGVEEDLSQENMATSVILANEIVEGLPDNARVSILPYADRYVRGDLNEPRLLASHREEVLEDISSVRPQSTISYHERGLRQADNIVSDFEGSGNVVMLSNGRIAQQLEGTSERASRTEADTLSGRLITVGITDDMQEPREDEVDFLKDLAERTDGGFYVDGRSPSIDFQFDAGGGTGEMQPITVTDSSHFITDGYSTQASLADIDSTTADTTASQIVSASDGRPLLTTWRYGLGHVAAFSGDNQDLEGLLEEDPGLVGRTFSWSTQSEERDTWIEGERVNDEFYVFSRNDREGFTRRAEDRYRKKIEVNSTGFKEWEDTTYSVNYRPEIQEVGYNEERLSEATVDGRIYREDELEAFFQDLESDTDTGLETHDLTPYTLITALALYIGFIGLRKRNGLA